MRRHPRQPCSDRLTSNAGNILSCGKVAGVAGLEPVTSAVTGQRSNQLSYTPARGERLKYFAAAASQRFCPKNVFWCAEER